ncbi:hypothetical protein HU200_067536 [Digitaria exilis]|uniref:Uncharacterized protein n=1 Tax=Digitaria exilis TaxID=1010633 RepID=A0A835DW16_9POAL|nr:hypothetical protein HU200_067536 [Digitaria exilis]
MDDADEAASSIVPAAAAQRTSTSFENAVPQHLLDEALQVLLQQGHHAVAQRVLLFLDQRHLHDAMRLLTDEHRGGADTAEFHARLDDSVHMMLDLDDDDDDPETFRDFRVLVLMVAREMAGFRDYGELPELDTFGVVPIPTSATAAVAGLEKRSFGGGGAECSICFEDFVDGVEKQVSGPHRHRMIDCAFLVVFIRSPLGRLPLPVPHHLHPPEAA